MRPSSEHINLPESCRAKQLVGSIREKAADVQKARQEHIKRLESNRRCTQDEKVSSQGGNNPTPGAASGGIAGVGKDAVRPAASAGMSTPAPPPGPQASDVLRDAEKGPWHPCTRSRTTR